MKKQIVYIVELKKAYEDKHYVHLVMGFPQVESCSIGLFLHEITWREQLFFCWETLFRLCLLVMTWNYSQGFEAWELFVAERRWELSSQNHWLWSLRFLKARRCVQGYSGWCLLHSTRGFEKEVWIISCYLKYWCHIVYHLMWCLTFLDW